MSKFLSLLLVACYISASSGAAAAEDGGVVRVLVTGLFAYNATETLITAHQHGVANGRVVEAAVRLAIRDINARNQSLRLDLRPVSTECDPARSAWSISDTLRQTSASEPVVILGPPCEDSANHLVRITSRFTNILTVSYSATTPQINDASLYRNFFRTVPSFTDLSEALHHLLVEFQWNRICLVLESEPYYNTAAEHFNQNYPVSILEAVSPTNLQYITTSSQCRVFVVMTEPEHLAEVFCHALRNGLTGELYQWIAVLDTTVEMEDLVRNGNVIGCDQSELIGFVDSMFIIAFDKSFNITHRAIISTPLNREEFEMQLHSSLQNHTTANITNKDLSASASAYDATWAIAMALDAAMENLTESGITLNDYLPLENEEVANVLIESFESLCFTGVSTTVQFTPSRHSTQSARKVYQVQGNNGGILPLGLYTQQSGLNMTHYGNQVQWIGDGPPKDRPVAKQEHVPLWTVILMLVISVFGCVLLISFMSINCIFRQKTIIKASSPHINTLILSGCLLGFVSVIAYTLATDNSIATVIRIVSCNLTVWLVSVMFTLSFGALLAKTWRVHAVFRNPWSKRRIYKDYMLFVIVFVMLAVDLLVLLTWMIASPLRIQTDFVNSASAITEISYCSITDSGVYFAVTIIVYKCILLMVGCFLATQTRKIKAKFFNDTKYIVVAIYCVFLIVMIGLPVAIFMLIGYYIFLSYLIITLTIIGMALVISCVLFLPKVFLLYKTRKNDSIDIMSSSIKAETRGPMEKKPSLASIVLSDYRRQSQLSLSTSSAYGHRPSLASMVSNEYRRQSENGSISVTMLGLNLGTVWENQDDNTDINRNDIVPSPATLSTVTDHMDHINEMYADLHEDNV